MASYENPYARPLDDFGTRSAAPQPRVSGLAVASLVCSLIICCPIITLIGPLLGLSAIVSISANPAERRGKGLAIAGIIIGLLTTAAGGAGIYWMITLGRGMVAFVDQDVPAAVQDAFDGRYGEFRARLTSTSAQAADDAAIQAFVDALSARYGEFVDVKISETIQSMDAQGNVVTLPMQWEFADGTVVDGDIEVMLENPSPEGWRLHSITIPDGALGPIKFP